jgi:hypothetical protein
MSFTSAMASGLTSTGILTPSNRGHSWQNGGAWAIGRRATALDKVAAALRADRHWQAGGMRYQWG